MTESKLDGIGACVFDAYGTLFDVNAAAQHCAGELGDKWQPWRSCGGGGSCNTPGCAA